MIRLVAALFGLSLLVAPASAVTAQPQMDAHELRAAETPMTSNATNPCADGAYSLVGPRWAGTLNWYFAASSTPNGMSRSGVRDAVKRSFSNVTAGRNDCGLADNISASAAYKGTTSRQAKCNSRDGYNVVGFKSLSAGILAYTCYWYMDGRMIEADIQINSNKRWAVSLAACVNKHALEAAMTHEVGHAFGLAHVSEATHGRLTMSPLLNGLCSNEESTLGLGDVRGLEQLY